MGTFDWVQDAASYDHAAATYDDFVGSEPMTNTQIDAAAVKHADADAFDSVTDCYLKHRFIETCRAVQARGGFPVYPTGAPFAAARCPPSSTGA